MADGLRVDLGLNGTTWPVSTETVRSGDVYYEGYRPELDEARPGTLTLVMSNQDRLWDPDYTASPLAGYVDVGVWIRLVHTVNTVSYTIFTGIIDSLEQSPDIGNADSTTTVVAVDASELLASKPLPSAIAYWAAQSIAASGVAGTYLALDEDSAIDFPANPSNPMEFQGLWGGAARQDDDVAASAPGGKTFGIRGSILALPFFKNSAGSAWHISFEVRLPILAVNGETYRILGPVGSTSIGDGRIRLFWETGGTSAPFPPRVTGALSLWQTAPGPITVIKHMEIPNDGSLHSICFEGAPGSINAYLDGVAQPDGNLTLNLSQATALSTTTTHYFGASPEYLPGASDGSMSLGHWRQTAFDGTSLAAYRAWAAARHGSINAAFARNDTPAERIAWAVAQAGLGAGTIVGGANQIPIIGVRGGDLPVEHIRLAAASEGGLFYVDQAGLAQYRGTPAGGVEQTFNDTNPLQGMEKIHPKRDRARRITAARASLDGVVRARVDTGRTPPREVEFSLLSQSPVDAYLRCEAVVNERKDVGTVYDTLAFNPGVGNRWATAHALLPGSWVSVARTPTGVGSPVTFAARVEGKRHTFGSDLSSWNTELTLGVPTAAAYFVLGTSTLDTGRLG